MVFRQGPHSRFSARVGRNGFSAPYSSAADRCTDLRSSRTAERAVSDSADLPREVATFSDYRSEEHTSELQSQSNLVCRLLLEKKKSGCDTQALLSGIPASPEPTLD